MFILKPSFTYLIKVRAFNNKKYWAYVHKLASKYNYRLHVPWPKTSNFIIYWNPKPNLDINHTSKFKYFSSWWCLKSLNTNYNNNNNNTTYQQHCPLSLLHLDCLLLLLHPSPTIVYWSYTHPIESFVSLKAITFFGAPRWERRVSFSLLLCYY